MPSNCLSIKIAKTTESAENLNLKGRPAKNQPVISKLPSISSIAAFENLSGAESREKSLKAKQHCKWVSVSKLTQAETENSISLAFEALNASAHDKNYFVKCNN